MSYKWFKITYFTSGKRTSGLTLPSPQERVNVFLPFGEARWGGGYKHEIKK